MRKMEQAALQHVREYWRDVRSGKLDREIRAEIEHRAAIDRKAGHTPRCGILKCAPECRAKR